jgi:type I restriction enzyme S subunit
MTLNSSKLERLEIACPPRDEQRKIAAVLSLVQRAIEQQERLIALTTELKKALMHKLFTEGLHGEPQKETEIGLIPESWEVVPLGDSLEMAQYGTSAKGGSQGAVALLRMTNQRDGRITAENLQFVELRDREVTSFRVEKDDILFNRTNSFDLVGRTAIFELEGDFVFASYLIRLRTERERLRPHFLNDYFNAETTQRRLKTIATRAVSQSNISATRLRGFPIPIPPIDEQDEISQVLAAVDSKLNVCMQKNKLLNEAFSVLLHQLMTAQIRVNDLRLEELTDEQGASIADGRVEASVATGG